MRLTRRARLSTVVPQFGGDNLPPAQTGGMDTQKPLSLNRPGEALALISCTFGFLPKNSLVVIGLDQGTTGGHLRVDLPAGATQAPAESLTDFADSIAECLLGADASPVPEAALVLVFAPEEAGPGSSPYRGMLEALKIAFAAHGDTPIVHTWYIGGESIRDYDCADSRCCGYPGLDARREMDAVLQNHPLFAEQGVGRPRGGPVPENQGPEAVVRWFESSPFEEERPMGELVYSADEVEQLREDVAAYRTRFDSMAAQEGRPPYVCAAAWDAAISRTEVSGSAGWLPECPDQLAAMLTAVTDSGLRDAIIPMAALDFDTALCGYLVLSAGPRSGRHREKIAELLGREGRPVPGDLDAAVEDFQAAFLGDTGRRPDWARIDALEMVLRMVHAFGDAPARSHVLSLMVWVEWARGRGSIAGAYADRCVERYPQNRLAQLLSRYMDVGGICPWAQVKQHSWSWNNHAQEKSARKFLSGSGNEQHPSSVMAC